MNITKIICVFSGRSTDKIYLVTDLPLAIWPNEGPQELKMETPPGKGKAYCEKHFPSTPIEYIDIS